jgi:ABC-type transport system involved in multi-copper enzyme maturation permease subunit
MIILPALCVFITTVFVRHGDPDALRRGIHPSAIGAWSTATELVLGGLVSFFTLMWGLLLGAASVGEEFQQGTAGFLLSRPRRRRYWVWMGWCAGLCELGGMLVLTVAATFGTLFYLTGHVYTWWLLATTLPLVVGGMVAYGLTYSMTLVARSGRQGLSYGIGILFIDFLLPVALRYYWNLNFPSVLGSMVDACKWFGRPAGAFPAGALFGYTLAALAFPFATQFLLERCEA